MDDLWEIGVKGDETGVNSHWQGTLWYHNTWLYVHPKFGNLFVIL